MALAGGCLCGQVRYQANAEPMWICHCHCERCRRQTGAAVATYVGFPRETVEWLNSEPTRYRSSKDVERSFCSACGSTIGFHRVHETSLCLGSLDNPSDLPVGISGQVMSGTRSTYPGSTRQTLGSGTRNFRRVELKKLPRSADSRSVVKPLRLNLPGIGKATR